MHDKRSHIARAGSIKIIGFGNIFMSDDGLGIHVINELAKIEFFRDFELIDGGTSGVDLIFHLKESKKVIVIDAVDAGQKEGELITIHSGEIDGSVPDKFISYSLHGFNLSQVIKLIKALGLDSKLAIIGLKPEKIDFGEELSPSIEKKIPLIIEAIRKEITVFR